MQKYLNYVTAYTFVNIYQDILIFNYYEHFYYENTIHSLCRSGSTPSTTSGPSVHVFRNSAKDDLRTGKLTTERSSNLQNLYG